MGIKDGEAGQVNEDSSEQPTETRRQQMGVAQLVPFADVCEAHPQATKAPNDTQ